MQRYKQYVVDNKTTYKRFLAESCIGEKYTSDKMRVYNRLLFAFLSVNTNYWRTAKAYKAMQGHYHVGNKTVMRRLMNHGIHYTRARGEYISDATKAFKRDYQSFLKAESENWNEYRARLVKKIRGLSFIKVSFFITLLYPNADLCCLDRWILRSLGIHHSKMNILNKQVAYQSIEAKLRAGAQDCGVSMFHYQWAVWDAIRSEGPNPMEVLWQS